MMASPSKLRIAKKTLGSLIPAVLLSSCMSAPPYLKPEIPLPPSFRPEIQASDAGSFADLPWWEVFNDPALQRLINEALTNNVDLQVAVARIERARELVGVVRSEAKPQVGYEASGLGEKTFAPTDDGNTTVTYGTIGGLLNAAWEFDVWGRIRRATDAALANLLAQEDVRRGVILTLVSDVAAGYFHLIELDRELAIAEDSARVYGSTLELFTLRFEAGRDSRLPVERAQAAYDSSLADIQDLKRLIALQENAINLLLGAFPKPVERGTPLPQQAAPGTPLGSTTALLQRRPDILEAEQNMIRANAEIGVAVANFFPRIGLSTFLGARTVVTGEVWDAFGVWNLALSAEGPIYSGGRLEAIYRERQAFWDETVAQYKQRIVIAFREVSDALVAQGTLEARRLALESQVRALQNSSDLALMRYDAGRASYFEVLEAQQQLFPAQDQLAQTLREQLIAIVNLYKALGGGWSATAPRPAPGALPIPASFPVPPPPPPPPTTAQNGGP